MFSINKRVVLYSKFGWTEKAFDDDESYIRLEAYKNLGFTEKALKDKSKNIQKEAKMYLETTEDEYQQLITSYRNN